MTTAPATRVGKYFRLSEFTCRDGQPVPENAIPALRMWCAKLGDPLREKFGPVRITSGYRTASYNRSVGGASASYHRYDLHHATAAGPRHRLDIAADCVPARGTPVDWQKWARARFGTAAWGLGGSVGAAVAYPSSGFVHLDTGPRRTWAG